MAKEAATDQCNNANLPFNEIADDPDSKSVRQRDPWGNDVTHFTSGDVTWAELGMRIVSTAPDVPGSIKLRHLDPLELEVCVEFVKPIRLQLVSVYAWTNLYHADNPEGGWVKVPLRYVDESRAWDDEGATRYTWSRAVYPADLGEYGLMFCVQRRRRVVWASGREDALLMTVEAPDEEDSPWTQQGDVTPITKYISIGNTLAMSTDGKSFKTVIFLDSTGSDIKTKGKDVHHFPLPEGASNEIPAAVITNVILKLKECTTKGEPVLIADKLGQGRVGSLVVAYIYANNPCLSFSEAYDFVSSRRQIYIHKGLTNTLTKLYPRD